MCVSTWRLHKSSAAQQLRRSERGDGAATGLRRCRGFAVASYLQPADGMVPLILGVADASRGGLRVYFVVRATCTRLRN